MYRKATTRSYGRNMSPTSITDPNTNDKVERDSGIGNFIKGNSANIEVTEKS